MMSDTKMKSPDQHVTERFHDLCNDLNLDKDAAEEAWQSFERIGNSYTLEVIIT